ncbi:hypothetical protein [Tardisphaera saccharovorans]|nr:hypothetical protein [TACK group archaeon]
MAGDGIGLEMVADRSYVRATFLMRFLSLAAITAIPIMLRSNHFTATQIGIFSAAIWLGSGVGTIVSLVRPISLWKASLLGFGLTAFSFAALSQVAWLGFFLALGFGLSMVEVPSLDAAGHSGSAGIFSYYASLGLATLVASLALPLVLYAGSAAALLILSAASLFGLPISKVESSRKPFSFSHVMVFKQKYVNLFAYGLLVYMAYNFVTTFFGVRLVDLGYPAWLSQGSFILLFLGSFVTRVLHPVQLIDLRRLVGISLVSTLALLLPMPLPLFGLIGLGISHGLFPVTVSLQVASEEAADFAVMNVMVLSSTGFASFLAPLLGGYCIAGLGFAGSLALFSAFLVPALVARRVGR